MGRGKCTTDSIEGVLVVAIVVYACDTIVVCSLRRQSHDNPRVLLIGEPSIVYNLHLDFDPIPMGLHVRVRVEGATLDATTSSVQPD